MYHTRTPKSLHSWDYGPPKPSARLVWLSKWGIYNQFSGASSVKLSDHRVDTMRCLFSRGKPDDTFGFWWHCDKKRVQRTLNGLYHQTRASQLLMQPLKISLKLETKWRYLWSLTVLASQVKCGMPLVYESECRYCFRWLCWWRWTCIGRQKRTNPV